MTADMDLFKLINDQYGHATGDQVLTLFGQIVKKVSRESDIAGRIGGEEFHFFCQTLLSMRRKILQIAYITR